MSQTLPLMRSSLPGRSSLPSAHVALESGTANRDDVLKRLEEAKARHGRMRDQGIRWEGDIERFDVELLEASKEAMTAFKTSDPDALRLIDEQEMARITMLVEQYVAEVAAGAARLNDIAEAAQA